MQNNKEILIQCDGFILRQLRMSDKSSIAKYANNRKVSENLMDVFPYPYTEKDAEEFITRQSSQDGGVLAFAIDISGEVVGVLGIHWKTDIYRNSAELGYWLAEPFWGRGIVTKAVKAVVAYTFDNYKHINRIYAVPFDRNIASARVLEKAGFTKEGTMRKSVVKDGVTMDAHHYSILREEHEGK